jgi:hypothetical protein
MNLILAIPARYGIENLCIIRGESVKIAFAGKTGFLQRARKIILKAIAIGSVHRLFIREDPF